MHTLKLSIPYVILALVSLVYLYPFVRAFTQTPDAGIFLYGADLVSRGALPSRDFVEVQGPGSFVWLAIFFRLFGSTLETARAVLDATGVAMAILTFWLSRRLGGTGLFAALFVLVISIPLLPINSPHYDSNLFALGALSVFLFAWNRMLDGKQAAHWQLVVSAALCGVTTWMIQQKGLYMAGALLLALLCLLRGRALKPAALFCGVYLALALLPFSFFAAVHALPDVLYANYVWPLTMYSDLNAAPYGFPVWQQLGTIWAQHAHTPINWLPDLILFMPFFFIAAVPLLLPLAAKLSTKRWLHLPMLPYWLAAYALWFSELHRLDIGHLRNGSLLLATLFFSIVESGGNRWMRFTGLAITLCVTAAGASGLMLTFKGTQRETRRGNVFVQADDTSLLDFLDSHTHSGQEVFVYPYQPIFYFVGNLANPTRYSYLLYGYNTDSQIREAASDLEQKQVRYVVFDKLLSGDRLTDVFPAYKQPAKSALIMEPYLEAHYRVVNDLGRFQILERKQ